MSGTFITRLPVRETTLAIGLLIGAHAANAQILDLNRNGLSDIWEKIYGAEGYDPDADSDGDGASNRQEAVAGTDPCDPHSVLRISSVTLRTNGVEIKVFGALGKRYQLQTCSGAGASATNWIDQGSLIARTNPWVILTSSADLPMKFFRVMVSDVDTDGDGLSDWEEYRLGLDPLSATSNGGVDQNGTPLSDYRFLMNRLTDQSLQSLLAGPLRAGPAVAHAASAGGASAGSGPRPADFSDGTGLTGQYFTNSSSTYTNAVNFNPTNLFLTTNDPSINFAWSPALFPNLSNSFWTVRWTGQLVAQNSETYVFETRTDDGVKLWINDLLLIDRWQSAGTFTNALSLQAGVRYNVRLDYFNQGGSARAQLYWYSPNQPRQIIPATRLYPESGGLEPGAVISPLTAVAFVGQPFSYTIAGANTPLAYDATNLPPGLGFNDTNGIISGIPTLAGEFEISLTVSNVIGTSTAVLDLVVIDSGSSVTREVWLGVPGVSITNLPLHLPATLTNTLGNLEGITNFGDNYGERIRGYLIPPVTGNYYFWLAANNAAELWIANDDEPANRVRRVAVTKGTLPHQWTLNRSQRSGWLALEAGRRYYLEVLHKAGKGATDHWSVGWRLDPIGTNTTPAGVVPGYVLSRYDPTPLSEIPGTLYTANMLALPDVASPAIGSATLRVSASGAQAILNFQISDLSSTATSLHIDSDPYLGNPAQLIFDISDASPAMDGSYTWDIAPVGTLSAADIQEIINEGKASINVDTVAHVAGEISGHFTLANGSRIFTPPPAPPVWKDDHTSTNAAARFLIQATFGPHPADLKSVRASGYDAWINKQFKLPIYRHLTNVYALAGPEASSYPGTLTFNTWWQQSVTAPDQLRQRVAFALSEILVVSENGILSDNARALSGYYDILLSHAFGNFRELLEAVTLSPSMGLYLDMRRNDRGSITQGTHPNENYAREIMQLFSIGLNRLWPDGTLVLNSKGDLVPSYDQDVIIGFARVFTGWNYSQTNQANKRLPNNWNPNPNYTNAMVMVPSHHELGTKRVLDSVMLPAAQGRQTVATNIDLDVYCTQDMELALDSIFYNENVGPFICRQLIQRLVTSHPSRDYLYRVVQKFKDNGAGVRGDLKAVIKAILLDYDARSPAVLAAPTYGKQREPLLRATAIARALPAPPTLVGTYRQNGSQTITVTTSKPHRLSSSDDVYLKFTGKPAPLSQIYNNVTVTDPRTFTITASGVSFGTYGQSGTTLTVTNSGHGLAVGRKIFLTFTSGGAANAIYTVNTVISGSVFTVLTLDSVSRVGTCIYPKWTGSEFVHAGTNIVFTTLAPHGLAVGKTVYVDFPAGIAAADGVYRISAVSGPTHFTIGSSIATNQSDASPLVLPLTPAPLARSGSVALHYSTWNMNYTDAGFSSSLYQTPLNSPTVFNFFFPDYKFPGALTSAGLTTPEFQLTSDTSTVLQMNFLSGAIFNNGSNTNGLSSFASGNGSIMLDFGSWMTPALTSNAGIPGLVDSLNTLLCGGELSAAAKTVIVNYVTNPSNFPYTIPTATQMRDRVRAVVHLIVTSPDFNIQR